ncbi:MAG: outer membrane autotransporter protein [Flavobacteriales bacterium]|jgi:outer membrane autotransporter protein
MKYTYSKLSQFKCTTAVMFLLFSMGYANAAINDVSCLDIKEPASPQDPADSRILPDIDREINFEAGCMASSLSDFLLQNELNQLRGQHNQLNSLRRNLTLTTDKNIASIVFPFKIDGVAGGSISGVKQLSFYITADSKDGRRELTSNSLGFDFKGKTLLLGLDFQLSDSLFIGTSFSGIDNKSDFDLLGSQSAGSRDINTQTWVINVAKYWNENWALQSQLSFSKHEMDSVRNSFGNRFVANTNSDNQALMAEFLYTANFKGWRVTPSLGLTYLSGAIDEYQETIAVGTGQAVSIASQDITSLSADLSVQIDRAFLMDWGVLIPNLRLSLNNEFEDDVNRANVTLVNRSTTAPIGDGIDKSTTNIDMGVSGQFTHGWSGFMSYRQLSGHQYLTIKTFSMGVRLEF